MKSVTWADMGLGVWLVASPFVIGYPASRPVAVIEDIIPGIFLFATSCWILAIKIAPLRVNWFQALCGLWLIIGSFALLFGQLSRGALNDLIVGILVLAVNLDATSALLREPPKGRALSREVL
jgi:SPW repeat-containing protein